MGKKRINSQDKPARGTVAEDENGQPDEEAGMSEIPRDYERQDFPERRPIRPAKSSIGVRIYKPGQGYYTRIGTAVGAGVLIVAGGYFVFDQLGAVLDQSQLYLRYGITVGFLLVMTILLYWVVGINRKANDFFIATEGEMKKVSWSSRKDVIRSTKVVITTVFLLAAMLFVVDIVFMLFFQAIGVLEGGGLSGLFGGSGS
jgi:preprotein translocase subunit SecE